MRAEIEITPAYKCRDVGFDRSMVGGYGHDDRVDAPDPFIRPYAVVDRAQKIAARMTKLIYFVSLPRAEEKSKQNFPLSGNFSARAQGIRRNMKKRSAVHRARHSVYVHAAARRCFWSASSDRSGVGQLPPVNFRFHYGRLNIRSRSPTGTTVRPAGSGPATAGTAGRRLLSWWALPTASFHRWSR